MFAHSCPGVYLSTPPQHQPSAASESGRVQLRETDFLLFMFSFRQTPQVPPGHPPSERGSTRTGSGSQPECISAQKYLNTSENLCRVLCPVDAIHFIPYFCILVYIVECVNKGHKERVGTMTKYLLKKNCEKNVFNLLFAASCISYNNPFGSAGLRGQNKE